MAVGVVGRGGVESDIVQPGQKWAGWAFQEENDVLAPGNNDKYYTQGLRFSRTRSPKENPEVVDRFGKWFLERFDNQLNAGLASALFRTSTAKSPYRR